MDRCVAWMCVGALVRMNVSLVLQTQKRSSHHGKLRLTPAAFQSASTPERMCDMHNLPLPPRPTQLGPRALS